MIKTNQKGNTGTLTAIFVVLLLIFTGVAVYFWQNYEKQKAITELRESMLQNDEPLKHAPTSTDTPSSAPVSTVKAPVVVYTPNGLFTADEIVEIQKKYINPFVDWNIDNKVATVSITIEKPSPAIAGYKYKVTYINEGGGNGGFLYGTNTPLEWWVPECLGGCKFSDSFKAKYPEIVALTQ